MIMRYVKPQEALTIAARGGRVFDTAEFAGFASKLLGIIKQEAGAEYPSYAEAFVLMTGLYTAGRVEGIRSERARTRGKYEF